MNLHPWEDVTLQAQELAANGQSSFQQFRCIKCGTKQTMEDVDIYYTHGKCEECGTITDIRKCGCNLLAMITNPAGEPHGITIADCEDYVNGKS